MKNVVVIGEILAEIMAVEPGNGFMSPLSLIGPFPSGAPAIFIDQVARMGQPCAIISTVGDDDFGKLNIERLKADGVDVSGISIDPDRPTGTAFVRYRKDGKRDFVFNIKHSAAGHLAITPQAQNILDTAGHLHVMGSSFSSSEFVELNLQTARAAKARGGSISFDPNLRKELLSAPGISEAMAEIVSLTDIFLPSGQELTLLTKADDEAAAITELLHLGVGIVIHKNGSNGASYHSADESFSVDAFPVDEIDPTGAGDSFGGAFTALWLQGAIPKEALTLAAAAGAFAVSKRGPMEGTSQRSQIEKLAQANLKAT